MAPALHPWLHPSISGFSRCVDSAHSPRPGCRCKFIKAPTSQGCTLTSQSSASAYPHLWFPQAEADVQPPKVPPILLEKHDSLQGFQEGEGGTQ